MEQCLRPRLPRFAPWIVTPSRCSGVMGGRFLGVSVPGPWHWGNEDERQAVHGVGVRVEAANTCTALSALHWGAGASSLTNQVVTVAFARVTVR